MKRYTDTELLDCLQYLMSQKKYTGRVVLRASITGRGWVLHETSGYGARGSVREAIIYYIENEGE